MGYAELDLLVRIGGAASLLFVALIFWGRARGALAARMLLPLSLCLACFMLDNSTAPSVLSGRALAISHLLAGLAVPFLWWFCLALFDRSFRLTLPYLGIGVLWVALALADRGYFGPALDHDLTADALLGMGLAIVAHLAWTLIRDRDDDMVEWRRHARIWVVGLLAGLLFFDLVADLLLGIDWISPGFAMVQNLALVAFAVWLGWRMSRSDAADALYGDTRPLSRRAPLPSGLAHRVEELVRTENVHLDPDLTLSDFVARCGASERAVREHINRELGFDHFRAFLGHHRVREACRRLADPAHAGDKLITIAYDSGFASLASFNRIFRAETGRTPSEFRAAPSFEERLAEF